MNIHADNFTVCVMLLMVATCFMIFLRMRRPVEDNWPLFYWVGALLFALNQFDSFKINVVMVGLFTALLLRFEFMNSAFSKVFKGVEFVVFGYVLVRGLDLIIV